MKTRHKLHIIAGEDRGRRLNSPKDNSVRPTASMAREAIFSILQDRIPGSRFLDLYAGTGAVGLEALSRGAESVTLVENHRTIHPLLKENIQRAVRADACSLWTSSVESACEGFARRKLGYDLIFMDPPYEEEGALLSRVEPLLAPHGILMRQRPSKWAVGDPFQGTRLVQYDVRRYGKTEISFWTFPDNLE
jgi:16S rRNA (guanine(966)-N(2))-methyltransferase RsmD